jgi:hypothetical protein
VSGAGSWARAGRTARTRTRDGEPAGGPGPDQDAAATSAPGRRGRGRREDGRSLRRSVVAGGLLAVLVLLAGGIFAATQHKTWTAETALVVLPSARLDPATSAAFYETLSRGQIVATFAEVGNDAGLQARAMDALGLPAADRAGVSTALSVVPDTSVILVRSTADDASVAERVADGTAAAATSSFTALSDAYRTQVVRSAAGSAFASGLSGSLVLALAVLVALVLGLAVQQAVYHLLEARTRTTAAEGAG